VETIRAAPEAAAAATAAAAAANSQILSSFGYYEVTYVYLRRNTRASTRVVPIIHLITEKPDPPVQCAAAARDNSRRRTRILAHAFVRN